MLKRRKLRLNAKVDRRSSQFNFKCLVPGAFHLYFIGSTCTASPCTRRTSRPWPGAGHSSTFQLDVTHFAWDTLGGVRAKDRIHGRDTQASRIEG